MMKLKPCPVCEERSTYPEGAIDPDTDCYLCKGTGKIRFEEPLPCRLCGCDGTYVKADIYPDNERKTIVAFMGVYCPGCQTTLQTCEAHPQGAIDIYNTRPTEDALRDENERLKGRLTKLCDMCDEVESKYGCFTHRIPEFVDAMAEQSDKFEAENDKLQKRVGELEGKLEAISNLIDWEFGQVDVQKADRILTPPATEEEADKC